METRILPADDAGIALAAERLREGAVVAFPTETVYGLGGRADRVESLQAIFSAKGRPTTDPLILHLESMDLDRAAAEGWIATPPPETGKRLARNFWPGPLSLILKKGTKSLPEMTAGRATVAVRCPAHPVARKLLAAVGIPLAAPSANRFGRISATDAAAVREELGGMIPFILDGGPCSVGLESTVVNLTSEAPEILRPGAITANQLASALGVTPQIAFSMSQSRDAQIAPGQLASHYAPRTPMFLCHLPIRIFLPGAFHLLFQKPGGKIPETAVVLDAEAGQENLARELYRALRRADASGCETILVDPVPDGAWATALRDRLARASSGSATWEGQAWKLTPRSVG